MTITFEIPVNIEQALQTENQDPNLRAKEIFLVDLYRRSKLFHSELAQALGLSRYETDGVLKHYGIMIDLTEQELGDEVQSLRQLIGS